MKDTFYFPHDYNAHSDPKISAMIKEHGLHYYGLYWALIEIMHSEGGKIVKFPKLFDGISAKLMIEKEALLQAIEAMSNDYKLFKNDQKHIFSERVLKNIKERKIKSQKFSQAGRIGGLRSGVIRNLEKNEASLQALKQRKERKERKKDITKHHENEKEIFQDEIKSFRKTLKWSDQRIKENLSSRGFSESQIDKALGKEF